MAAPSVRAGRARAALEPEKPEAEATVFGPARTGPEIRDRGDRIEALLNLVRDQIRPDSWRAAGDLVARVQGLPTGRLVVRASEFHHRALAKLLRDLSNDLRRRYRVEAVAVTVPTCMDTATMKSALRQAESDEAHLDAVESPPADLHAMVAELPEVTVLGEATTVDLGSVVRDAEDRRGDKPEAALPDEHPPGFYLSTRFVSAPEGETGDLYFNGLVVIQADEHSPAGRAAFAGSEELIPDRIAVASAPGQDRDQLVYLLLRMNVVERKNAGQ